MGDSKFLVFIGIFAVVLYLMFNGGVDFTAALFGDIATKLPF